MDDQRDYAEEAAVRADIVREGEQELAAEREEQLIQAIRNTIAAGRDRGDSSSAILGQVESLLAGVETFTAARGEHIDRIGRCGECTRAIEHIVGIPDPYWRHVDNAAFSARPHAARPVHNEESSR